MIITRTQQRNARQRNDEKMNNTTNNTHDEIDTIIDAIFDNNEITIIDVANTFANNTHDAITHNDDNNDEHFYIVV